jgi:XTP/dITP diphosphohydrolase
VTGRLVVATANPDKLREIEGILRGLDVTLCPVVEMFPGWDVEETGSTLSDNALLKAESACRATGLPAVADDTGLFVAALGGAPGIYSARYAGAGCSYEDNVRKLLMALAGERGPGRRAEFRTAAALVRPEEEPVCVTGRVEGSITLERSGEGGFGYDPVFESTELGKTFSEAAQEEKDSVSHRRRALQRLRLEMARARGRA